ncbi:MAG: DUF1631 domain-containing protein [Sulfuritalea sp.]|nr:DUF1631 domain-containing protein [Sulfuritalea sp.]
MSDIDPHTAERLLRQCRDLLEHDLGELIEELAPAIAEEVLALIDSTRDEARKAEYLRLRTDLQSRWETLTSAYRKELSRQLQPGKLVTTSKPETPNFADLQIVDDKDLAEQIVMREFFGRVSEACSEEIYALDRRIGYLNGSENLDEGDNNPFGPATVCAAVRAGCTAMYADLDQHTLLLRQLERHLQAELPHLYRAINEVLIEAAILPTLKRSYRPAAPTNTQATAADAANILNTIQRLAQVRSQAVGREGMSAGPRTGTDIAGSGSPGTGSGSGIAGEALPPDAIAGGAALFESLQALQAGPGATPGELTNVVRLARGSEAARQILPLEAITLDIVAMLFDLIFADDKVPNSIKGLVSRLQIPILKVAILDQQFFADRSHPARRFLDSISGIATRWGQTVDEGDPFYLKLSELVERIQNTFGQDADIFATAITELAAFVTEHESKEVETARTVAEIVQRKENELRSQRERQATSRLSANSALAPLLATALPLAIEQFLLGHWRDVLHQHALESGTDSTPFLDAKRIAGELVWSIAPKTDADERKRQAALLPKLVSGLNQGLDQIGTSADARRLFMDALMDLTLAAIRGVKRGQEEVTEMVVPPPVDNPAVELQVTHSVENGVRIEEVSLPERETAADGSTQDRASLRRVKHLVRGDWVDFIGDDGQGRRERLTWISPSRSLFLFSNHAANCAISITPEALAHRLQTNTARLVERDAPMFERALDGAIKALDQPASGHSE